MLIWSGPGGRGGTTVAQLAEKLGLAGAGRKRRLLRARDPERPRRRRRLGGRVRRRGRRHGLRRPPDRLGRRGGRRPERARPRGARRRRHRDLDVPRPRGRLGRPRPPGHELPRARGHVREPRGPPAAAPAARRSRPRPTSSTWIAKLAARFDVQLSPSASSVFAEVSERCYDGPPVRRGRRARPASRLRGCAAHVDPPPLPEPAAADGGLTLVCYKPLFSGPAVERVSELQFQRPRAEITIARDDAAAIGVANGDVVTLTVSSNGHRRADAPASEDCTSGIALVARELAEELHGTVSIRQSAGQEAKT